MKLDSCLPRIWNTSRPLLASLVAASSLLVTGCSEPADSRVATFPVSGSITFRGQAIPGAFVTLHPVSPQSRVPTPRGSVDRDGKLHVTTYLADDGAPAGDYALTVEWYKPIRQGNDVVPGPNALPRKYASPQTSQLSIRIAAEENVLPPIAL